jgi:hypothetical protein
VFNNKVRSSSSLANFTLLCGRCNLWAFRREWLRDARSDPLNPRLHFF